MSHVRFLSLNICRSTKVAQHFPNLGDKSRSTFSEWCRVIGQLGSAVFTMEYGVDEIRRGRRKMLDQVTFDKLIKSEKYVNCLMQFCDHDLATIIMISDRRS